MTNAIDHRAGRSLAAELWRAPYSVEDVDI